MTTLKALLETLIENEVCVTCHTGDAFSTSMIYCWLCMCTNLGWFMQKDICGIKWVSGFSSNFKQKLPSIVGLIILNSTETGEPMCHCATACSVKFFQLHCQLSLSPHTNLQDYII